MIAALFLAGTTSAYVAANTTTTVHETKYVTIPCENTTITYGSHIITVSSKTTLTIEDCGCTSTVPGQKPSVATSPVKSVAVTTPALANGAVVGTVGAAAGVAAAVAYLL